MSSSVAITSYPPSVKPRGEKIQIISQLPKAAQGLFANGLCSELFKRFDDNLVIMSRIDSHNPEIIREVEAADFQDGRKKAFAFAGILGDLIPYTPVVVSR